MLNDPGFDFISHAQEKEKRLTSLEVKMISVEENIDDIKKSIDLLLENMNKLKGFWAGVVAAGTALGAALGALLSYIFSSKLG